MSLSFSLLISAVPLYRRDRTLKAVHQKELRLCLFSDGGLSSNFSIHFFDSLLPSRPTFGVALDEYDVRRDRRIAEHEEAAHARPDADVSREQRVYLPKPAHG